MLNGYKFGEMTVREENPPRRLPWAFDNGAYKDFTAERPFQEQKYLKALGKGVETADFVAVPDIVTGGLTSLEYSLSWVPRLKGLPLYLVVQDGMEPKDVLPHTQHFRGFFVGGSLPWKLATSKAWIDTAHSLGLKCHVGRVGTGPRVRIMRKLGADSIDSALPLFSIDNFRRFLAGFKDVTDEQLADISGRGDVRDDPG